MATVLEELLIKVGVDVDQKEMKQISQASQDVAKTLTKVALAGAAAAAAITAYTLRLSKASDTSIKFARSTGIAFAGIQELEFAAQREGAAAGEMTSTLQGLTNAIGQLAIGRGPREAVRRLGGLGITFEDLQSGALKADTLLLRLGESIKGLPSPKQVELLSQFGVSQSILQLLQQGRFSIGELREEARRYGLESVSFGKRSEKLNDALLNQRHALNQALKPLRLAVIEIALRVIPAITNWVSRNKELLPLILKIGVTLIATGAAISLFVKSAMKIWAVVKVIQALTLAMKGLAIAKGAVAATGIAGGIAGGAGGIVSGGGAGALLGVGGAAGGGILAALAGILPFLGAAAVATGGTALILKALEKGGLEKSRIRGKEEQVRVGRMFERIDSRRGATPQTITETFNFTINGATDEKKVARQIQKEITSRARNSVSTFEQSIF